MHVHEIRQETMVVSVIIETNIGEAILLDSCSKSEWQLNHATNREVTFSKMLHLLCDFASYEVQARMVYTSK